MADQSLLTIKEQNVKVDWTPRLKLFCIGLTSGENNSADIKLGMVWRPQLADSDETHTNTTESQGRNGVLVNVYVLRRSQVAKDAKNKAVSNPVRKMLI